MALPEVRFRVALSHLAGHKLVGCSSPYVKWVFDNFKEGQTSFRKCKGGEVDWESFADAFAYSTRYEQRLSVKSINVEVWEKNTLSSDRLIGGGAVDLYAIATGPRLVEIQLTDKTHSDVGIVTLEVELSQQTSASVAAVDIALELDDAVGAAAAVPLTLHLSLAGAMMAGGRARATAPGAYACADEVRIAPIAVTPAELFGACAVITCSLPGDAEATVALPMHHYYRFVCI